MCQFKWLLLLFLYKATLSGGSVSEGEEENGVYSFPELEQVSTFLQPLAEKVKNEGCKHQLEIYLKSLKNSSLWAVQMLDASGKVPQGLLTSDAYNLGNYDGCIDINLKRDKRDNIYGKYCLATLKIINENNFSSYRHSRRVFMEPEFSTWNQLLIPIFRYGFVNNIFRTGICIPNQCTHRDVEDILVFLYTNTTKLEGVTVSVPQNACSTKESKETPMSNIIHQFIFWFFFGVTAITIFDLLGWLDNSVLSFINFTKIISAYRNFRYLTTPSANHVPALDSLRIYTVILFVVCRRFSLLITGPIINRKVSDQIYDEEFKKIFFQTTNAVVADTFLMLNGFLAHYKVYNYVKKNPKLPITRIYIAEYLKSIPLQIFVMLYYSFAFETIGDGPMWRERTEKPTGNCQRNWVFNVLNLNNLIGKEDVCVFESWCFAVIAHCFLTVPIVAKNSSTTGYTVLGLLTAASLLVPRYPSQVFANDTRIKDWYKVINIATKDRAFPYFCGIWCSIFYLKIRDKTWKISKNQVKFLSVLSVILFVLTLCGSFVLIVTSQTAFTEVVIDKATRLFWIFFLSWTVIGVSTNKLPALSPFLIRDIFTPLARLIYPYLLIIGMVQLYTVGTVRTLDYLSIPRLVWMSSADLLATVVFAFVFYMMIHRPLSIVLNTTILKVSKQNPMLKTSERDISKKTKSKKK